MKIGDKVKYYFNYGYWKIPQIGIICEVYKSDIFSNRFRYGAKRIDKDFIDGGYREDFTILEKENA